MSGENWTPGPWFVSPTPLADGRARVEDGRTNGLETIKCEWSEAHLVAAAPELYEALKHVYLHYGEGWDKNKPIMQETLAKARGEDT